MIEDAQLIHCVTVYMPKFCVQGARIPFYVIWDAPQKVNIKLNKPDGLTVKELYNIDPKDLMIKDSEISVRGFEVDGYFGGVFDSVLDAHASTVKTVTFAISSSNWTKTYERKVELFRPDIKVVNKPQLINVKADKNNRLTLDSHIEISNLGKATGIVRLNTLSETELRGEDLEGMQEFRRNFSEDLTSNLGEVAKKFSQYSDLIELFQSVFMEPLPIDKTRLENVRITIERLEEAFNNNEKFFLEFLGAVVLAYLKNVSITTDLDSFLAYIRSIAEGRVILLEPLKAFKVSATPQKLISELVVTDLVRNKYEPIRLPDISLRSNVDCIVPAYQILNFVLTR